MLLIFDGGAPPPAPPPDLVQSTFKSGAMTEDGVTFVVSLAETAFQLDTSPLPFTPSNLFFSIEGDDVRASWDGSIATAMEGHRFYSGQQVGFSNFKHFDRLSLFTMGTASTVRITIEGA